MPRKASGGDGAPTKTSAKGTKQASAVINADSDGSQILDGGQVTGSGTNASITTAARGGSANKGVKRRRTSNNVNSNSGPEIYGSGTIVASNPFDDDHMPLSVANHNVGGPPSNKMIMTMTHHPQQQSNLHPTMPHQANHPPHHQPHHHHQQMPLHHQHHQQPMHHHHHHPVYHQNNHHYHQPGMQQQMPLPPQQQHQQQHGQIGNPPGHMQGVSHQGMPPIHHHQIMSQSGYGPPPPRPQHQIHQQVHHPQGLPHQQQQQQQQHGLQHLHHQLPPQPAQPHQSIDASTPPHMISAHPGPTHSPYNTTIQQAGGPMMSNQPQPQGTLPPPPAPPQPAQVPVPLQQQQQQQQAQLIPPSHDQHHPIDPMTMQQIPHNQFGYCGKCQREVFKQEQHIICKAGCMSYFHISCSGLTQLACDLLMKESLAEWACDRCTSGTRRVPYIKYKT